MHNQTLHEAPRQPPERAAVPKPHPQFSIRGAILPLLVLIFPAILALILVKDLIEATSFVTFALSLGIGVAVALAFHKRLA